MNLDSINSYWFVIAASVIIIISYFFNLISKKWNVPSVLMLIALGIILRWLTGIHSIDGNSSILGVLGVVGLIMIVLEASLDLELKRDKVSLILKSFFVALIALSVSVYLIALFIQYVYNVTLFNSFVYAIPLSIMSSAIIIPSVSSLPHDKKEFMIYESTFSDILGIMFFYFLLGSVEYDSAQKLSVNIAGNIFITILISVLVSYVIIYLFQKIRTEVKLFLLVSVLVLLYALGKMMHLSSLIIILFFGLILHNRRLFFRGRLSQMINHEELDKVFTNFKLITIETAFVVRTFFFVIFGLTISLSALFQLNVVFSSLVILAVLYGARFVVLRLFIGKDIIPELFIAPRGLITVLLFFAIPVEYNVPNFESGILLFLIIASSIIMAISLIKNSKAKGNKVDFVDDDFDEMPTFKQK
ncbi:MAG: cation:proton antiporter [Bacteroidales bacterium]|nr:cation:proton antiporter [Bacteroidales bacterium]